MKAKKLVAIASTLLLTAGLFSLGTGVANATSDTNHPDTWETQAGEVCVKYEPVATPYVLPSPDSDRTYSKVIIKAGSSGHGGVIDENTVYTSGLIAGNSFTHVSGKNISHVILCTIPSEQPKVSTADISFEAPSCDTDQKLVLGSISNATWGTPVYSGVGNRDFSVTATSTAGAKFADGSTTKTFTGTLLAATGGCNPPPCLPDSAVSYTYDSVTNSGIITVTARQGHSAELCNPFWVTAASWTFDGNTMWPQTLDQWNPANGGNAISSVGTYPYAAAVDCGQGDIYATFNSPGVPYPTAGVLNGPSNPYAEHFLHQMGFTGPHPTYTVQDAAACSTEIITSIPGVTFVDECGTANDSVSVPSKTGVIYTTNDQRVNGVGTVTVTATAAPGYAFDGSVRNTTWSHDFTDVPCPIVVDVVPAVTFTDDCGTANDGVTVPTQTGVVYATNDQRVDGVGTVTVTATPANGYVFANGLTTSWTHVFTNVACPIVVNVLPAATFTDLCTTTNDAVTIPTQTGVVYTTDDQRVDGVGTVTVTATPADGYVFADGQTTSWSHVFTDEACPTIKPIAPLAVDPMCDEGVQDGNLGAIVGPTPGYIDLDLKDHLHYKIDGVSTTDARNYVDPGLHTVSVTVDDGYTLEGPASWDLIVNEPFCPPTLALLSTSASSTNITCTSQGSYTLENTEGIQWFVNGSATPTAAGTYQVAGAGTVNVEAMLIDPINDGWEDDAQKLWSFNFTDPTDCLPTLAFTGSTGNSLGLLLAGGLLLFGGAAIAFERTFRFNAK